MKQPIPSCENGAHEITNNIVIPEQASQVRAGDIVWTVVPTSGAKDKEKVYDGVPGTVGHTVDEGGSN